MRILNNVSKGEWKEVFSRPTDNNDIIKERVENILEQVKNEGDKAIFSLSQAIDKNNLTAENVLVSDSELKAAANNLSDEFKAAICLAKENIEKFHAAQLRREVYVETMNGVEVRQRRVPISKVGLYIPAGSAPLFSTVLMCAVPAKIAGCSEIIMCSPANKEGKIADEILYVAQLCGVSKIYKLGGAIAVGAMAYGSETIDSVHKIFGPGNRYVTYAKQIVSCDTVAIDMPAGPSEVMVLADESAEAAFVASDILSQLEHGADSQAIAIVTSQEIADNVADEVLKQTKTLSRNEIIELSLKNCTIIVENDRTKILEMVDFYAPEHLIVSLNEADEFSYSVTNAGSIFIGNYSPESVGDYASGTNHTLPTSGWAKSFSGVNTDSFSKYITYQKLSKEGLNAISDCVVTMAQHEGLTAHANAVIVRKG
ncbi:MAG: histidinol dehydrogenase [Rikenellaceae bacterium]